MNICLFFSEIFSFCEKNVINSKPSYGMAFTVMFLVCEFQIFLAHKSSLFMYYYIVNNNDDVFALLNFVPILLCSLVLLIILYV